MDHRRPYAGLVGQPNGFVEGLIFAWWGNPHSELPQRGTQMNHRWPYPGLVGQPTGFVEGLIPARWGNRIRNCPNGAKHTSPGCNPG